MELDKIPGLKETVAAAQAREEELRDVAMVAVPLSIAGIDVRQLTPRQLLILYAAGSPYVCGGVSTAEALVQFLWIVSERRAESGDRKEIRDQFIAMALHINSAEAEKDIETYLDGATFDRPAGSSGSQQTPSVSFVASLVHEIASAYGWDDEVILDKPIARLYQYLKLIVRDWHIDHGAKPPPMFNRLTDAAKRRCVQEYLAKQRAPKPKRKRKSKPRARRDGEGSHE